MFYKMDVIITDGVWEFDSLSVEVLGSRPIRCLMSVNHQMWASCAGDIHTIATTTRYTKNGVKQHIDSVSIWSVVFKKALWRK